MEAVGSGVIAGGVHTVDVGEAVHCGTEDTRGESKGSRSSANTLSPRLPSNNPEHRDQVGSTLARASSSLYRGGSSRSLGLSWRPTNKTQSTGPTLSHPLSHVLSEAARKRKSHATLASVWDDPDFFDAPEVDEEWSQMRKRVGQVMMSDYFIMVLAALITLSMVLLVMDTDIKADTGDADAEDDAAPGGGRMPLWGRVALGLLLVFYTAELGMRLFVFRAEFFWYVHNVLDLVLVAGDMVLEIGPLIFGPALENLAWFRVFRVLRLCRLLRLMYFFPMLRLMLKGLMGAFRVMFWGMILVLIVLFVWAVLAVHMLNDFNRSPAMLTLYSESACARCPDAFSSVFEALVTFTKHLFAQDGWGEIAIPMIQEHPITFVFFFLAYATVSIAILNLILAVIVDTALETRRQDVHHRAKMKEAELEQASKRLHGLFQSLDTDRNGFLSQSELEVGFTDNVEFMDVMASMDITVQDVDTVFAIMDQDHNGDVDYTEFVQQLHKIRTGDTRTLLVFIRCIVSQIRDQMVAVAGGGSMESKGSPKEAKIQALLRDSGCEGRGAIGSNAGEPTMPVIPERALLFQTDRGQSAASAQSPQTMHEEMARTMQRMAWICSRLEKSKLLEDDLTDDLHAEPPDATGHRQSREDLYRKETSEREADEEDADTKLVEVQRQSGTKAQPVAPSSRRSSPQSKLSPWVGMGDGKRGPLRPVANS